MGFLESLEADVNIAFASAAGFAIALGEIRGGYILERM